jgi:predicted Zn finger-like uncharacterized protein
MMNQVACPGCQAKLRVDDKLLGKSIKCPKCGQVMKTEVPAAEVVEEVEELPPDDNHSAGAARANTPVALTAAPNAPSA